MDNEFKLYFDDLKPEAQARLLKAANVKSHVAMNWDIYPVTIIEFLEGGAEYATEIDLISRHPRRG